MHMSLFGSISQTEVCAFSENKIYPGRGTRFVRRDGQLVIFSGRKTASLYFQRKKPAKLTWTTAWRRLNNKKTDFEKGARRRRRAAGKVTRGFAGMSRSDFDKKKASVSKSDKPTVAQMAAAREAARRARGKKAARK